MPPSGFQERTRFMQAYVGHIRFLLDDSDNPGQKNIGSREEPNWVFSGKGAEQWDAQMWEREAMGLFHRHSRTAQGNHLPQISPDRNMSASRQNPNIKRHFKKDTLFLQSWLSVPYTPRAMKNHWSYDVSKWFLTWKTPRCQVKVFLKTTKFRTKD